MSIKKSIGWAKDTWNPFSGCSPVSEACYHCYAARIAGTRLKNHPRYKGLTKRRKDGSFQFTGEVRFHPDQVNIPRTWRKPRRVFPCSMCDLFHEHAKTSDIYDTFEIMERCTDHKFSILTKRPDRATSLMHGGICGWDWRFRKHIWLGITGENQARLIERIQYFHPQIASIQFVSFEPLLGPIDISKHVELYDWGIIGVETGPGKRLSELQWIISLVEQHKKYNIPLFMKDNLKPYWPHRLIQEWPE